MGGNDKHWYRDFGSHFILAEAEGGKSPPQDWSEWSPGFGRSSCGDVWAPFKWYCDPTGEYFRLAISAQLSGKGLLVPVIAGVIGKSIETDRIPAGICYLHAGELATDLSGLAVVDHSSLLRRALLWYAPLLRKVREHCDNLDSKWDTTYPAYPASGALSAGASDPISLLAVIPVWATFLLVEAVGSRLRFAWNEESHTRELRQGIKQRIDDLISFLETENS